MINNKVLFSILKECNRTEYEGIISFNELSSDYYLDLISESKTLRDDFSLNNLTLKRAQKSFIVLSIFYDSLSYTQITESPQMDFIALLGSIGGNLGLFLGVSVFSFFEIVEAMLEIYFIRDKV